jgi:hypothetical protein
MVALPGNTHKKPPMFTGSPLASRLRRTVSLDGCSDPPRWVRVAPEALVGNGHEQSRPACRNRRSQAFVLRTWGIGAARRRVQVPTRQAADRVPPVGGNDGSQAPLSCEWSRTPRSGAAPPVPLLFRLSTRIQWSAKQVRNSMPQIGALPWHLHRTVQDLLIVQNDADTGDRASTHWHWSSPCLESSAEHRRGT